MSSCHRDAENDNQMSKYGLLLVLYYDVLLPVFFTLLETLLLVDM